MNSFILGKDNFPIWFKEECKKGRVKILYDEDENVKGVKIFNPTKTIECKMGDKIIKMRTGLSCIPYKNNKGK